MICLGVYLVVLGTSGAKHAFSTLPTSDTGALIKGARTAADCIHLRVFTRCGLTSSRNTAVAQYPLLQYIPAVLLVKLHFTDHNILQTLVRINGAAFLGTLGLLVFIGNRLIGRSWGFLLAVACVSGPLGLYAVSAFGEPLATLVVTLYVAAVLCKRPVAAGMLLVVACLTKETVAPFLLLIGLICARDPDDGLWPARQWIVSLGLGSAIGVAVDAAFNVFRYGTPLNMNYLDPIFRTPGVRLPASFSAAMWFSPNAGLLFFWPLATLLIVGCIVVALLRRGPTARDPRSWMPPVALLLAIVGFTIGLGEWWAPFGWVAWGPRLILPMVPAFVLAALYVGGGDVAQRVRRVIQSRVGVVMVMLIAVIGVVPQVGAVWTFQSANDHLFTVDSVCPRSLKNFNILDDAPLYYRCLENAAWRTHSLELPVAVGPAERTIRLAQLALAASVVTMLLAVRRRWVAETLANEVRVSMASGIGERLGGQQQ